MFPDGFHSPFRKTVSDSGESGPDVDVSGSECPEILEGDPGIELDEVLPVSFSCTCNGFRYSAIPRTHALFGELTESEDRNRNYKKRKLSPARTATAQHQSL